MSGDNFSEPLTCFERVLNLSDSLPSSGSGVMGFSCLCRDEFDQTGVSMPSFWRIDPDLNAVEVVATVVFIFFLLALIWNSFIIITYLVKRELLKQPGNIFLFNIAVADLLIALSTMLFSFVTLAAKEFVFGTVDAVRCGLCDFAGTFFMMLIFTSTFILAALSIDRFIHLAKPLQYDQIMKPWRAWLIVSILWVCALIIGILPVIGFGQHEFNINFGACIPRFSGVNVNTGLNNQFYVYTVAVIALIPIFVLIITNVGTYRLVSKFLKRNFRRKTIYKKKGDEDTRRASKQHKMQQKQLVRVFSALLISTAISWTPVIVVVAVLIFIDATSIPEEVYIFGWICYITNPVFHPIIESFFVKDLRHQVRRARRTIRKQATTLFKKSSQFFSSQALDQANRAMDKEESSHDNGINDTTMMNMTPSPTPELTRSTPPVKKFKKKITFSDDLPSPHSVEVQLKAFRPVNPPPPIAEVEVEIEEEETELSTPNGWIQSPSHTSDATEAILEESQLNEVRAIAELDCETTEEDREDTESAPSDLVGSEAQTVVTSVEIEVGGGSSVQDNDQ